MDTEPKVVFPEAELYREIAYTGENSAYINDKISDFTITDETATGLSFTSAGTAYAVPPGGYVVYRGGAVTNVYLNEDDLRDSFGGVLPAVEHYHELVLKSGPALPSTDEA